MTRPLFLFRPEPGWSATRDAAQALGIAVRGHALFSVEPVQWTAPDPRGFDGLLVGSANAIRHGRSQLALYCDLPVLAVGAATARAARETGFAVERVGEGGLQGVLDTLSAPRRLLRLAGEQHVDLSVPEGVTVETRLVYRSTPLPIAPGTAQELAAGGMVALHSGEAARHFRAEADRLALPIERLDVLALGPRIADLAGAGWRSVHTPAAPRDGELLAMAHALCQT